MFADAPPAVVQIAQRTKRQEAGVVLYRLHRVFDVHAGPMGRHDDLQMAVVSRDAQVVKVRVLHAVEGGKTLDATRVSQIEDRYEHPKPGDVFHRPFDLQYLDEYTYQAVDAKTYRFASVLPDSSHADGTMSLDDEGNVVRYVYTPNVLPQYASSGAVTDERSQVLPSLWQLTREVHEYRGHYFVFGGGATAVITYDSFERYADLPAAEAALDKIAMRATVSRLARMPRLGRRCALRQTPRAAMFR